MDITVPQGNRVPAVLGPYSQAVRAGDFVYVAGQAGIEPTDGRLISGGIESETRRTLLNLRAVLEAAGCSLQQVVKTSVYLTNLDDFPKMNAVYKEFFHSGTLPVRTTVQVAGLVLGAVVEVDCVALIETTETTAQ